MSIITIILAVVIAYAAVRSVFLKRGYLILNPNSRDRRQATGFFLAALMHAATLAMLVVLLRMEELPSLTFTVVAGLILFGYVLQMILTMSVDRCWRAAPLFWIASLSPLLGCVLVGLIWRAERVNSNSP